MVKYICENCFKEFDRKSSYDSHNKRKNPCLQKLNKIEELEKQIIELQGQMKHLLSIKI